MITVKQMETIIGRLLTMGVILSCLLVLCGGFLFLFHHGSENSQSEILQAVIYTPLSFTQAWHTAWTPSSGSMIELGLFILVMTQIARVGLLFLFYISQQDYWFIAISFFILTVLICSFTFQK